MAVMAVMDADGLLGRGRCGAARFKNIGPF
jgi:hypothetical protein